MVGVPLAGTLGWGVRLKSAPLRVPWGGDGHFVLIAVVACNNFSWYTCGVIAIRHMYVHHMYC